MTSETQSAAFAVDSSDGLHAGFLRSARQFPDRLALEVGMERLTYSALAQKAASLAATLQRTEGTGGELTAVFAYRTATAYAGVLAALMRGHGYVPLNRTFPAERTRLMLERSGCRSIIVDAESAPFLESLLEGFDASLVIVAPDNDDGDSLGPRVRRHTVVTGKEMERPEAWQARPSDPNSIAYLLFTSGSTGIPKGVVVLQRNVHHFVQTVVERYGITERDRFSQTFDMTFDLSVFDMFVAWERGACVCCLTGNTLIAPGRFIQDAQLTVWFSVPSTGVFMRRLGMLKPDRYPSLRWSLFCGEPLPTDVAQEWSAAAPHSTIENLYGPTELTIACTAYRWDPERSPAECERGLVPIGSALPGMEELVADAQLEEVPCGREGELLMTGPQLTAGYWRDPDKTATAFVVPPGRSTVHYRTGDVVRRRYDGGPLHYLGRLDHQIKVQGHRVELGEIEAVLRKVSGADAVIAVGWPRTASGAGGVVAFIGDTTVDAAVLRRRAREVLPDYMVPREILLEELPLNANGKYDRNALVRNLERRDASGR